MDADQVELDFEEDVKNGSTEDEAAGLIAEFGSVDRRHRKKLSKRLYEACAVGDLSQAIALIAAGADINVAQPEPEDLADIDAFPAFPLLVAAANGHEEVVRYLFTVPSLTKLITVNVYSALFFAAQEGHASIVQFLLDSGEYEVDAGVGEETALHVAALRSHIDVAELLLAHGANVDALDNMERTPLYHAAYQGKDVMVKMLLERGASTEHVDSDGQTALFHACMSGFLKTVQVLVEYGHCNVNHVDHSGRTPFDIADIAGMNECASYLWHHGATSSRLNKGTLRAKWTRPYVLNKPPPIAYPSIISVGSQVWIGGGYRMSDGAFASNRGIFRADLDALQLECIVPQGANIERTEISMDTKRAGKLISLGPQNTVSYTGSSLDWASAALSDRPFNPADKLSYYEATIINSGERHEVAVGIAKGDFPVNDSLPGWKPPSFALHGDNGMVYDGAGFGDVWGVRFKTSDVVGCGVIWETGEVFFTLNGEFLGVACAMKKIAPMFACLGLRSPGAFVALNFGASPFRFDFYAPTLAFQQYEEPIGITHRQLLQWRNGTQVISIQGDLVLRFNLTNLTPHQAAGCEIERVADRCAAEVISTTMDTMRAEELYQSLMYCIIGDTVWAYCNKGNTDEDSNDEGDLEQEKLRDIVPELELLRLDLTTMIWSKHVFSLAGVVSRGFRVQPDTQLRTIGPRIYFFETSGSFYIDTSTLEVVALQAAALPVSSGACSTNTNQGLFTWAGVSMGEFQSDIMLFDPKSASTVIPRQAGVNPRTRRDGGCGTLGKRIIVFGGWDGDSLISDLEICVLDSEQPAATSHFFDSPVFSDVVVSFNNDPVGRRVRCHKVILACRSQFFREQLSGGLTNIQLDTSYKVGINVLRYIYNDIIDGLSEDESRKLARACQTFIPEHTPRITEKLVLSRTTSPSSFGRDLAQASFSELFSDIRIRLQSGLEIPAHKVILASRSHYFRAMFLGGLKEANQVEVELLEFDTDIFRVVLTYIYSGDVSLDTVSELGILQVMSASLALQVPELSSALEAVLANNVDTENATELLQFAQEHGCARLAAQCMKLRQL